MPWKQKKLNVSKTKNIYVVGTEDIAFFPHYGRRSNTSVELDGFAHGFFLALSEQTGLQLSFNPLPVRRLFHSLLVENDIDFKYPDNPNWQQELKSLYKVYYSKAISQYIDGTFVHHQNMLYKRSDIRKIGTIRGFTPEPYTGDIAQGDMELIELSQIEHMLNALIQKHVDAVYVNTDVAKYKLDSFALSQQVIAFNPHLPYTVGNYYLSTVKHPSVLKRIDAFIETNPDIIKELINRYQLTTESSITGRNLVE